MIIKRKYNSLNEKLLAKIIHNSTIINECIIYTASLDSDGYGEFYFNGKKFKVHRLIACITRSIDYNSYVEFHHKCSNKACFNNNHLEALTKREHSKITMTKKFCTRGHDINIAGRNKWGECNSCYSNKRKTNRKRRKVKIW